VPGWQYFLIGHFEDLEIHWQNFIEVWTKSIILKNLHFYIMHDALITPVHLYFSGENTL
jgi:hypothetical protein